MRLVGWAVGWALVLAATAVVIWDLVSLFQGQGFPWRPLGAVWAAIDRNSLLLVEPAIVRHLSEGLWSGLVFPLLEAPAVAVFGLPGLLLLLLCRRRRPKKIFQT